MYIRINGNNISLFTSNSANLNTYEYRSLCKHFETDDVIEFVKIMRSKYKEYIKF